MLVVGAGFTGAVIARELAEYGYKVRVIDKRDHIGGNAYDYYDDRGVLVHKYGPHAFHTNSVRIWEWLSRFTEWHLYEHRILANIGGELYPFPINTTTLSKLYGNDVGNWPVKGYHPPETNAEAYLINRVGRELTDLFYRGYSEKQWGRPLSQLDASIVRRIAVRTNTDDRVSEDKFQGIPLHGYTRMFENILDHKNIRVELERPFFYPSDKKFGPVFYTGPIDKFFGEVHGSLPYRSLRFEFEHHHNIALLQPVAQINYPGIEVPYTRTTEYKHMTGQLCPGTTIAREFSQGHGDPYYPVDCPESRVLYQHYKHMAAGEPNVKFVGRLAEYRYYNMDQAVGAALAVVGDYIR